MNCCGWDFLCRDCPRRSFPDGESITETGFDDKVLAPASYRANNRNDQFSISGYRGET
jgi:hypothetical protein